MATSEHCPTATLKVGDQAGGFVIERVAPVPEIRATAYEARHQATGARLLHLHCEDRENLFAVTFRTPPPDSTGVAHILEHAVLAGSQHYPLKDVFNELIRGSLATFLNAFTAPDFTCYPVCSEVPVDFYNLASVYTDLVLRPLLTRNTFMREGHHLELNDAGDLVVSGIVFNEMKGAFSTPERTAQSATVQGLFPGTPYGVESGGRPEKIPTLTYEAFNEFHRRFYSPSNARLFFYGNLPTRGHLEFVARQLTGCGAVAVDSGVPSAARWEEPQAISTRYPIGPDDPAERRTTVNLAWLTAPAADVEQRLILEVLQEALIGNPAAPLRKALIDSGLGEDLSPTSGLLTWYKELPFIVGLRGTEAARAREIEKLTLDTLGRIAQEGIATDMLEAAIHQVEFKGLEISRSPMPFSIMLLFRTLSTWLHENDALLPLTFPTLMNRLREEWTADEQLFNRAVRRWLVDNPHRLRAATEPSRTLADERKEALRGQLADRQATMKPADLEQIQAAVAELTAEQQTPNSPEDLARLPRLELDQIPREVVSIPTHERAGGGVRVMEHDLFSNGIAYVDVVFDVADAPEEMQPYMTLLGAAATGMGAGGQGYEAFATRKALLTGGVAGELSADEHQTGTGAVQTFALRGRALERNAAGLVAILRDILVSGDLSDKERFKDVLAELRNGMRASVAPEGHYYSWRTAAAGLSVCAWRHEQWHGAEQLRFLAGLLQAYDAEHETILGNMDLLRRFLLRRGRVTVNLTGDEACLRALRGPIDELLAELPEGGEIGPPGVPDHPLTHAGVAIPGEVCYVARALPVPGYKDPAAPLLWVLAARLARGYLHKQIRVEGGAYGGMAFYAPLRSQFAMLSYRDPHLLRTLATYDTAIEAFLAEDLGPEDLRATIIGALGKLDRPMDPATKGREALRRAMIDLEDDDRLRFREGVLAAKAEDLRQCAKRILGKELRAAPQCVYGPRGRIEAANEELPVPFSLETLE